MDDGWEISIRDLPNGQLEDVGDDALAFEFAFFQHGGECASLVGKSPSPKAILTVR